MGKHVSLEPLVHSWNPPPSSQEEVLAGKQHARPPMLGFFSQKNLIESPRDHRHPVLHLKLCCFIIQKNPLKFENPSKRQTLKKPKKFLADYWILFIASCISWKYGGRNELTSVSSRYKPITFPLVRMFWNLYLCKW